MRSTRPMFTTRTFSARALLLAMAMAFTSSAHAVSGGGESGSMPGKPNYVALEPPFTVNILDNDRLRYLQIGINLMSMDVKAIEALQAHMAPVRHELLMLFAHRDIAEVMGLQAREELRHEALQRVQEVLFKLEEIDSSERIGGKKEGYPAGIQELLFTSFVIQ